jgi:hypothetical protein
LRGALLADELFLLRRGGEGDAVLLGVGLRPRAGARRGGGLASRGGARLGGGEGDLLTEELLRLLRGGGDLLRLRFGPAPRGGGLGDRETLE